MKILKKWLREAILVMSHNLPFPTRVKIRCVHNAYLNGIYFVIFYGKISLRNLSQRESAVRLDNLKSFKVNLPLVDTG